jgi:hypothetical protein
MRALFVGPFLVMPQVEKKPIPVTTSTDEYQDLELQSHVVAGSDLALPVATDEMLHSF